MPRTSRILCPEIATFSQPYVCINVTQAKQIINLLLLSDYLSIYIYIYIDKFETEDELLCTVWSLVMVQLLEQEVDELRKEGNVEMMTK